MKKEAHIFGSILLVFLLLFSITLVAATNHTENDTLLDDEDETTTDDESNEDKIEEGFQCLEDKADNCKGLTTQELALTILATPDNIFDECVDELKSRKKSDNWGNVKDTAFAILAMNHAGESIDASIEWLQKQEKTPTELVWYLQQDSNGAVECNVAYDGKDNKINIGTNKKIDRNAGSCLTRSQSSFWLKVNPECFDEEFKVECDQDFITSLLYQNKNSATVYVLEGTQSAPAFGTTTTKVNSKCFGDSSGCNYESTAWATVALLETGNDIEEYIPYLIALSDTNKRYLPEAFIYIATNHEEYATKLFQNQKLGNYWLADASAYNKVYDTSLALVSVGDSTEKASKAKDWLLFTQAENGCWQNSIRDTAFALWALTGRAGRTGGGGSVTYCTEAGNFCIPSSQCPTGEDVGDNFFCPSLSTTCCTTENLQACSELSGTICGAGEFCAGNERKATDTNACCLGVCEEIPQETECEAEFYSCRDSCSDSQEEKSFACNQGQVCCGSATSEPKSNWWIWVLIIAILLVLLAIGYIKREDIKNFLFKLKSKFKKDKGGKGGPSTPGRPGPGRPGYPPARPFGRYPPLRMPTQRREAPKRNINAREDKAMSETFKKLQEMSS